MSKIYSIELDYRGRRRIMPVRYETRAEAREHRDRIAPLFRARVVVVPGPAHQAKAAP